MGTLYSDIYIDGANSEVFAVDGAQIKEAWLDGECIWKLTEGSDTIIYLITYYEGMYYAIGSEIDSQGNRVYCILVGETLDKLARYYSVTKVTSLKYNCIFADSDGLFVGETYYGYTVTPAIQLHMKYIENLTKNEEKELSVMFSDFTTAGLSKNAISSAVHSSNVCDSDRGVLYVYNNSYTSTALCQNKNIVETITLETHCYKNMHVMGTQIILVIWTSTELSRVYTDWTYTYEDYEEEKQIDFPIIKSMNIDYSGKNDISYDLSKYYKEFMEELISAYPNRTDSCTIWLGHICSYNSACNGDTAIIELGFTLRSNYGSYVRKVLLEYRNGSILLERHISEENTAAGMLLYSVGKYFVYQYPDVSDNVHFTVMLDLNSYTDFVLPEEVYTTYTNRFIRGNKLCFAKQENDKGTLDVYEVDVSSGDVEYIVYDVKSYDDLEE